MKAYWEFFQLFASWFSKWTGDDWNIFLVLNSGFFFQLTILLFLHLISCVLLQFCELWRARIYNTSKRNPVSLGGNEGCLYQLSNNSQPTHSIRKRKRYLQWMCGSRSRSLEETECNSKEREKKEQQSDLSVASTTLLGIQKKKENWTTTRRVVRYECIEPTNSFLYSLTSTAIGLSSSSSRIAGSILIFISFFLSPSKIM